jgi:putative GTP pyrophosphokinase
VSGRTDRPTITIVLRPTREGDFLLALRSLLKRALRDYGLHAIKIEITPPGDQPGISPAVERGIMRSSGNYARDIPRRSASLSARSGSADGSDGSPLDALAIYTAWTSRSIRSLPPWGVALANGYPGGSRSRVTRAGGAVRLGTETAEDLAIINTWRAAHKPVLNTFQAILRFRTRETDVVVAQRHKRKRTIFGKLKRYPSMELARMDDVAGCRLIFPDVPSLYAFRAGFHRARFQHKRKNTIDKYDYIKSPKETGYRGIHDIYEYDVRSRAGKSSKGLLLELQYRTRVQHAWAIAVEVIGNITSSQPKFQEGDRRYEEVMAYASEILARAHEQSESCFPGLSNNEILTAFFELDDELGLMKLLRALNAVTNEVKAKRNVILVLSETEELQIHSFTYATDALRALFEMEQKNPGQDIVLVRADSGEEVREAFRNYFSDPREFIDLMEHGCEKLAERRVMHIHAE